VEKKALGRGLEALLPHAAKAEPAYSTAQDVQEIPLQHIIPNRYQPRTTFSDDDISQLSESIKQNGLLQPIIVRRRGDGIYELIAGERRFRAAKMAGLPKIRAIVRNSTDEQAMELALVENVQRQDLNPMEAARAYHRLITEFGFTQETVAQRIGKDRSSIANIARLIHLPPDIQGLVESGQLTTGHAKVLLGLSTADAQHRLAQQVVREQLSVRQAEKLAAGLFHPKRKSKAQKPYTDLEERLQRRLGTRVSVVKGRKGGKLVLHYFGPEELERLVEILLA